ncbi:MAG: glycosyltransferase family 2 protein [Longimicrobiaceae bacterium]
MSAPPGIAVVVPTLGRPEHVEAMLASLAAAAAGYPGPVQVLVVDDSGEPDAARIRAACAAHPCAEYLRGEASVRRKRNQGVARAAHPIVLFVDSDCSAAPDLFHQHARPYADDAELAGVAGVTEFVGADGPMWRVIQSTQFLNAFSFARRMEYVPWATCSNVSYRREVLERLGGFETSFPFRLGGDDADLGIRVNAAGLRIRGNPQAVVFHARDTWSGPLKMARRAFRWGRMDLHLYYLRHRDRLAAGLPRFTTVLALVSAASVVQAVLARSPLPLALPLLWAALALLAQAAATAWSAGRSLRPLPRELMADLLGLCFEVGTAWEGLRRLDLRPFYLTVRRGPVLPVFQQREWVVQQWSMLLALAAALVALPWLR